ncbi:hypothetical protein GEMRC1_012837 [Eukaryota sp. GEM-RC1]
MNLTDEQASVIQSTDNPLFVNALAGTGKTETLCQTLIYHLSHHPSASFLVLTFTKSARSELQNRISVLLQNHGLIQHMNQFSITTYHSLALLHVRSEFPNFKFSLLSTSESLDLLCDCFDTAIDKLEVTDADIEVTVALIWKVYTLGSAKLLKFLTISREVDSFLNSLNFDTCAKI